ncbi:MAG: histone deacetylase [Candidatus Aenigmatarchaeota archaeon]
MMMKVVYSPECLGYDIPGHPESPERVRRIHDALKEAGYTFIHAGPASKEDVLLVHTPEHYNKIRKGSYGSADVPMIDIKYPLLAAGVTIKASDELSFALTRPPGHHASSSLEEGFCYFNNVAIAVKKRGQKTAILDLDVHHGNGTQDIFMGSRNVIYVSLHQVPLYPMTGTRSQLNCHNFPLFPGTTEDAYMKNLEKALEVVSRFRPEILAVSMGFDTYEKDPLGGQKVTAKGFGRIGKMISGLGLPTFIALEGGYSSDIGTLCRSFLDGF